MSRKLFIVEFGEPHVGMSFSLAPEPSVFVVAKDYNEAAAKALEHIKNKVNNEPKSIFTEDGSLRNDLLNKKELNVKAVRYAGEVIW